MVVTHLIPYNLRRHHDYSRHWKPIHPIIDLLRGSSHWRRRCHLPRLAVRPL